MYCKWMNYKVYELYLKEAVSNSGTRKEKRGYSSI